MAVDFSPTAADYARHRAGFPPALFRRLRRLGLGGPQRILDLGTGTGVLARALARRGGRVVGLDVSQAMLREAAAAATGEGLGLGLVRARAERLPFPDSAFAVVAAGQCWHWFDRPAAAAELARVLVPGGLAVLAHLDWICRPGSPATLSEEVMAAHSPAATQAMPSYRFGQGQGIYGAWLADLERADFRELETFSFDTVLPYTREAWAGRIRASAPIGGTLTPEAVAAFDAEHRSRLAAAFGADPLQVPHRVFVALGRRPALPGA